MFPLLCVCPHTDTDQAYYELIVKKASALLSSVQLNMLKLALSLRAYSATAYSFQQVSGRGPSVGFRHLFWHVERIVLLVLLVFVDSFH